MDGSMTSSGEVLYRISNLLPIKYNLTAFESLLQESIGALEVVLGDDDAMLALLLTERANAIQSRHLTDKGETKKMKIEKSRMPDVSELIDARYHQVVEAMLQEHCRSLHGILSEVLYLERKLVAKQELVKISMDSYRNNILRTELSLSIAALGTAVPTLIAGFFGMNIEHDFHQRISFNEVCALSAALGGTVAFLCFRNVWHSHRSRNLDKIGRLKAYGRLLDELGALDRAFAEMATSASADSEGISREKFQSIFSRASNRAVTPKETDLVFEIFDADNSGSLQGEELAIGRKRDRRGRR
ncbi:unnamed protein product [Amoebophrya sp. A25]|nr:unnamed protein product [Amoebophrya sp. A25]|eukprot:GSA25T00007174001.1